MQEQVSQNWLQRLKEESWEAELLVSAVSIFAIFNAFYGLHWLVDFFISNVKPSQYFFAYSICYLGYLALGILGAFFFMHFGLRAYWIGLVGLNSVFPDYNVEDSAYSEIYTRKMAEALPKLPSTIEALDEICSTLFSAAFTLLIIYIYLSFIFSAYLLLFNLLSPYIHSAILIAPVFAFVGFTILTTLWNVIANLKRFKNNETIQSWYFTLIMWYTKIGYGPFYKYLLQTSMIFGSNFKRKKNILKTLVTLGVIGIFLSIYQAFQSNILYLIRADRIDDASHRITHFYGQYNESLTFLLAPEIPSEILTKSVNIIFVPIFKHETKSIKAGCDLPAWQFGKKENEERQRRWQANLDCYAKSLSLSLNGQIIDAQFLKSDHPTTQQFGLRTFIDLSNTESGAHMLTITKRVSPEVEKTWHIPFYYAPN